MTTSTPIEDRSAAEEAGGSADAVRGAMLLVSVLLLLLQGWLLRSLHHRTQRDLDPFAAGRLRSDVELSWFYLAGTVLLVLLQLAPQIRRASPAVRRATLRALLPALVAPYLSMVAWAAWVGLDGSYRGDVKELGVAGVLAGLVLAPQSCVRLVRLRHDGQGWLAPFLLAVLVGLWSLLFGVVGFIAGVSG